MRLLGDKDWTSATKIYTFRSVSRGDVLGTTHFDNDMQ